jgi:hypothetical protein
MNWEPGIVRLPPSGPITPETLSSTGSRVEIHLAPLTFLPELEKVGVVQLSGHATGAGVVPPVPVLASEPVSVAPESSGSVGAELSAHESAKKVAIAIVPDRKTRSEFIGGLPVEVEAEAAAPPHERARAVHVLEELDVAARLG